MTLKVKALSAIRWTTFAAIFKAILSFIQIAILARILSTSDFGLIAITSAILNFSSIFADFGLNGAFVQKQDVSQNEKSSLFWVSVFSGCVITTFLVLTSGLMASVLVDSRLENLIKVSALTLLISSFSSTIKSSSEKNLTFKSLVAIEIFTSLSGFAASIYFAWIGQGVYAMVYGAIIATLINTVFAWMYLREGWLPLMHFKLAEIKRFMHFGSVFLLSNLINYFNSTLDLFVGTRLLGASALGLYSVPRNLILQIQFTINPVITRVGFPLIASIQNDIPRLKRVYLTSLNMTTSSNAMIYVAIAFLSEDICHLLLGNQWSQSSHILSILAFWGLLRATLNPVGILINGTGNATLALKWNLTLLAIYLPAIIAGAHYGLQGLALGLLVAISLLFLPAWYFLVHKVCGASLADYLQVTAIPSLVCIFSFVVASWIAGFIATSLLRFTVGLIVGFIIYLFMSIFTNRKWLEAMLELIGWKL